jgi:hypothetical protein
MRFRELRRLLQSIVIAGLPAGLPACDGSPLDPVCSRTLDRSFDVRSSPQDPTLQLRIERCRVDADACFDLCDMLMQRAELPSPGACAVTFDGDDAHVETTYTVATGNPGCASEGRRPEGLLEPGAIEAPDAAGRWLAQAAWLEAASIPAFVYLARELDQHRAPRGLVRAALAAVQDEIRHARIMRQLAMRHGARVPKVTVPAPRVRTLEELAIENVVEGCVRETWGAVIAGWQAHRAADAELRAIYRAIAEDEARHAALGWAIDEWARTRLPAAAHARIDARRDAAVRELFADVGAGDIATLGLPAAADEYSLLTRTATALWAA